MTEVYRCVEGIYLSRDFNVEKVLSGLSYEPEEGDIFIVSYPKCGTTWLQFLAYSIFSNGVGPRSLNELFGRSPFLEYAGADSAKEMVRPGTIKSHLPGDKLRLSQRAKYICVARNPYDCCVSYFYHTKLFPAYQFEDGTFDAFFDMFIEGKVEYGNYFDHLLSWHKHHDAENVFFVTYEELKRDIRSSILKLADIFGEKYGNHLRDHPNVLERIVSATSFEKLKVFNAEYRENFIIPESVTASFLSEGGKSPVDEGGGIQTRVKGDFFRKGIVGDWKNHFSREQSKRMEQEIALKWQNSDVMNIWKYDDIL